MLFTAWNRKLTGCFGAAFLAGLRAGVWDDLDKVRRLVQEARRFEPHLPESARRRRLAQWHKAVQSVITYARSEPT